METDNLVALKDDMVAFIEGHGMRRLPGYVTEDIPAILWETEAPKTTPTRGKTSSRWPSTPAHSSSPSAKSNWIAKSWRS